MFAPWVLSTDTTDTWRNSTRWEHSRGEDEEKGEEGGDGEGDGEEEEEGMKWGEVKGDTGGESSSSNQSRTSQREPGLGEGVGEGGGRFGAGGGRLSADMPGVPMGGRGPGQGGKVPLASTRSNGDAVLPRFWYPAVGGAAHSCSWE